MKTVEIRNQKTKSKKSDGDDHKSGDVFKRYREGGGITPFNIAILGMGTVGGGVYEVLKQNEKAISEKLGFGGKKAINVKYVLDRRKFEGHDLEDRVTCDFDKIIADDDVSVVVETMGGANPAFDFSMRAMESGKSVVTSNKEVVAKYAMELFECARRNNVCYLYEASVGGGIPLIEPLKNCLVANEIKSVHGILNGTTNFILTKMNACGTSFEDALKEAQKLGYAELDPSADILGLDALRKICILAGLAYGHYVPTDAVPVVNGITEITKNDIESADALGYSIKLLGSASKQDEKLKILVAPHLVKKGTLISATSGVFNAVSVTGNMVGEVIFYGSGAGSLPTASAVVSDIIEAIRCPESPSALTKCGDGFVLSENEIKTSLFVRTNASPKEVKNIFDCESVSASESGTSFITKCDYVSEAEKKLNELKRNGYEVYSRHFVLE